MITKQLIERIYSAATILRWNDHIRPFDFFEIDKQAHKIIIAYMVAKFDEQEGGEIDWIKLIEGSIFEFFQRIVLTDLKPEVYREIMSKKSKDLNAWVVENLKQDIEPLGNSFVERFNKYFFDEEYAKYEKQILSAAHDFSTKWEFTIIYPWNQMLYGIDKTKDVVESCVSKYQDFVGIKQLVMNKKYYGFLDLCGQLRFQQRWAQAFRQPKTTVLGHMFVVAIFAYLYSLEIGLDKKRCYNNFFSALFHDLPEILTKDIVSPVKYSVEGLEDIIKEFENKQVEERILPLLPESWHAEMKSFIQSEFDNRIFKEGKLKLVEKLDINEKDGIDGKLVEVCDKLSAYIEASLALRYGICSQMLNNSKNKLYEKFSNVSIEKLNFKYVFDYFK